MQCLKIKIYGRVQGVFFRESSRIKAIFWELRGFVRNESDGSVYIEIEGEEKNLNKFLAWCRKGPFLASVRKVEYKFSDEISNFKNFEIKY
ncbi:MAG: acylphosphatase [Patescibacteria group bacterium]